MYVPLAWSGYLHNFCSNYDGKVFVWGHNQYGALGVGHTQSVMFPRLLPSPSRDSPWKRFASGTNHTLGLTQNGELYAFGQNNYGQLGIGNTTQHAIPQLVSSPSGSPWVSVACGNSHSMGLTEKGELYTFGYSGSGELGLGNTTNQTTPQLVSSPSGSAWVAVSCGQSHSLAVTEKGELFAFGYNSYGQLGLGHSNNETEPKKVPSPSSTPWVSVSCGANHSMGLTKKGELFAFGYNGHGELGLGNTNNQTTPQLVSSPSSSAWIAVSCGSSHSLGITQKGELYTWGNGGNGELGLGNTSRHVSPQLLPSPSNFPWSSAVCGGNRTTGITSGGEIYVWGNNSNAQLGLGHKERQHSPQPLFVLWSSFAPFDLTSLLSSKTLTDKTISSKEDSKEEIHSALVSVRCPLLLKTDPVPLSSAALQQLLRVIYGALPTEEVSSAVLLELYQFMLQHELRDLEVSVFTSILEKLKQPKELIKIIRMANELQLKEVSAFALAHVPLLVPQSTKENLVTLMEEENFSLRLASDVIAVHANPNSAPQMKKENIQMKPLRHHLAELLQSSEGADFTIICNDNSVQNKLEAHRFLLMARSDYFHTLLQSHFQESNSREVVVKSPISASAMKRLLEYFYCGFTVQRTTSESFEILKNCDILQLKLDNEESVHESFLAECNKDVQENVSKDNCLQMLRVAFQCQDVEMVKQALELASSNFKTLDFSKAFQP